MLHRIRNTLPWRLLLRFLIVLQVLFTIGDRAYQWANFENFTSESCAIAANDPCQSMWKNTTYYEAAFQITTDVVISLLPIKFLVQLRRPLWEKILIALLMSTGLLASSFSIRKTVLTKAFSDPHENLIDVNIAAYTFSCAEMFVGIIGACLVCLKSSFYTFLKRFGIDLDAVAHRRVVKESEDLPGLPSTADSTGSDTQGPEVLVNMPPPTPDKATSCKKEIFLEPSRTKDTDDI